MENEGESVSCSICFQSSPGQGGEGAGWERRGWGNVCGAAVGNKTRGLQEGVRENCVKFIDFGGVQLGMMSQGMLPGGGIPWWPPGKVCTTERQRTAAHGCPTDKSLRDGVGILLGEEESTGVGVVAFTEPPRLCESLGDGLWGWNSPGQGRIRRGRGCVTHWAPSPARGDVWPRSQQLLHKSRFQPQRKELQGPRPEQEENKKDLDVALKAWM